MNFDEFEKRNAVRPGESAEGVKPVQTRTSRKPDAHLGGVESDNWEPSGRDHFGFYLPHRRANDI